MTTATIGTLDSVTSLSRNTMKIMIVVGARPNFMKAAPLIAAIREHNQKAAALPISSLRKLKISRRSSFIPGSIMTSPCPDRSSRT